MNSTSFSISSLIADMMGDSVDRNKNLLFDDSIDVNSISLGDVSFPLDSSLAAELISGDFARSAEVDTSYLSATGSSPGTTTRTCIDKRPDSPNHNVIAPTVTVSPSPAPTKKINTKQKRFRINYTSEQLEKLCDAFHVNSYPDSEMLEKLSGELGIPQKSIKIWFQNKRSRNRKRPVAVVESEPSTQTVTLPLAVPHMVPPFYQYTPTYPHVSQPPTALSHVYNNRAGASPELPRPSSAHIADQPTRPPKTNDRIVATQDHPSHVAVCNPYNVPANMYPMSYIYHDLSVPRSQPVFQPTYDGNQMVHYQPTHATPHYMTSQFPILNMGHPSY